MKKNFKKTMTMLTALTLTVGQCQIPAMATTSEIHIDGDNEVVTAGAVNETPITDSTTVIVDKGASASTSLGGDIATNNGTVNENGDNSKAYFDYEHENDNTETVGTNNGTVTTNNTDGTVTENNGTVKDNYGTVTLNNKDVVNNGSKESEINEVTENNNDVVNNDPQGINEISIKAEVTTNTKNGTVGTNYHNGTVGTNDGTVTTNYGNVETNNGTVGINASNETLGTGNVGKNLGTITDNYGTIGESTNDGTIVNNYAKLENNKGTINNNYAFIGNNTGTIDSNFSESEVTENNKLITENLGTVVTNTKNAQIDENLGTITTNEGLVKDNMADIKNNLGEVTQNSGTVTTNKEGAVIVTNTGIVNSNEEDAVIVTNTGTGIIITNAGSVETNEAVIRNNDGENAVVNKNTSVIQINNATVIDNTGTITTNYGKVEQNKGTVTTNNGTVYNYGGTVVDNTNGTEYFQISVKAGSHQTKSASGGTDLFNYDGKDWLTQEGSETAYTEILITPSENYYISSITGLPDGVTAERNDDGTWTLTIPSGTNLEITIPDAELIKNEYSSSGGSSSGGGSGSGSSSSSGGSATVNLTPTQSFNSRAADTMGLTAYGTPVYMDSNGNMLTVDPTTVVAYTSDLTTIANTFISSLVQVSPQDTVGSGTINPYNLYISSQAEGFYVPVSANVVSGTTYTVYYSNGDSYEITCNADGLLDLPIFRTKNIDAFNFVIVGLQATPIAPATA